MSDVIRIGIIGCDTSHVSAFTRLLHDESQPHHVCGGRVVAAYPSFSPDMPKSKDRVAGFTDELRDTWGVTICDSIEGVLQQADAILLESVDGRRHLGELKAILPAGKPVFVDKPFAASLADARQMVHLVRQAGLPCFSSSSLRFDPNVQAVLEQTDGDAILACDAFGPAPLDPTNPGLFWYGIHAVEMLFALMGTGCRSLGCTSTEAYDLVVGRWDQRLGTMRGLRLGQADYGATIFCDKSVRQITRNREIPIYAPLLQRIVEFFRTGQEPVSLDETLEIMAFIDAAWQSSRQDGRVIELDLRT
ncbi:MAG: Gfo/Idh/MocA family protein [Phycisphaerae bacterium]